MSTMTNQKRKLFGMFSYLSQEIVGGNFKTLKKGRELSEFKGKNLSFKDLRSDSSFECAKSWLSILCSALQQKEKDRLEHDDLSKTETTFRMGFKV